MAPVPIPFPLSSLPGQNPYESAGRLVNAYSAPLQEGAPGPAVRRRAPGLATFGTSGGYTGFRGSLLSGSNLFSAWNGHLVYHTSAGGAATLVGTLAGTGKCIFARNNNTTPQNIVVTENGAFVITTTTITAYPDADLPQPNAVCFKDGYFFFTIGDARCFASGLNTTAVNALDFTTCEAKSDTLLRPVPFGDWLILFGTLSTEFYINTANETGFPFTRSFVLPRGLISAHAVAGHDDGFGHALIFVADDCGVYQITGYSADKVSPPDLDTRIAAVVAAGNASDLEAMIYVVDGHPMWQLSCDDWTWTLDLNSKQWHERQSYGILRSRMSMSVRAFNKWLCGDTTAGNVAEISAATYMELGSPLVYRVESGLVRGFPANIRVARADFDIVRGVGDATGTDPIATDPQALVSWSDDGGVNWSVPLKVKLGRQQRTERPLRLNRLGQAREQGRRWRIDVSDPVYVGLIGGTQEAA